MQEIEPEIETDSGPLTKPKKPRSQAQVDAFQVVMQKRAQNVALRKEDKLIKASEILVKANRPQIIEAPIETPAPTPRKKAPPKQIQLSESEESEEEIIIVKAKPKKKKKVVRQIIIEDSESDTPSDSDSDDGRPPRGRGGRGGGPSSSMVQRIVEPITPKPVVFNPAFFFI
jgi:hypothetical protein